MDNEITQLLTQGYTLDEALLVLHVLEQDRLDRLGCCDVQPRCDHCGGVLLQEAA